MLKCHREKVVTHYFINTNHKENASGQNDKEKRKMKWEENPCWLHALTV